MEPLHQPGCTSLCGLETLVRRITRSSRSGSNLSSGVAEPLPNRHWQQQEQDSQCEGQQDFAAAVRQEDVVLEGLQNYALQNRGAALQNYALQAHDATQQKQDAGRWKVDLSWCTPRIRMGGGCLVVLFIILVIFLGASAKKVRQYHYGLVRNSITGRVAVEKGAYTSGVHFVGFWNGFVLFPSTIRNIQFSSEVPETGVQQVAPLKVRSSDSLPMQLEISVQYRRRESELPQLFQRAMTSRLQENIFISVLSAAFIKVMSLHEAKDCWTGRSKLLADFLRACQESLAQVHAVCWGLQFYRIAMASKYEQALVSTQVQKQQETIEQARRSAARVRAETEVLLQTIRANISVLETKSAAERYQLLVGTQALVDARKVVAEANATSTVRELLRLPSGIELSGAQLTFYQQTLMLSSNLTGTRFLVGQSTPPSHVVALSRL